MTFRQARKYEQIRFLTTATTGLHEKITYFYQKLISSRVYMQLPRLQSLVTATTKFHGNQHTFTALTSIK